MATSAGSVVARVPRARGCESARPEPGVVHDACTVRVAVLAPEPPLLGAEVVERRAPRNATQPRTRGAAPRVEAPPGSERLLERRAGQIFGDRPVAGQE